MKRLFNKAKISITIACIFPVAMLGGRAYYQYDKSKKLTSALVQEIDSKIIDNLTAENIQGVIRFYHNDPDLFETYIIELERDSVAYNKLLQEQSRKLISKYPNTSVSQLSSMVNNVKNPERAFSEQDSDFYVRNARMYQDILKTTNTSLAAARKAKSL